MYPIGLVQIPLLVLIVLNVESNRRVLMLMADGLRGSYIARELQHSRNKRRRPGQSSAICRKANGGEFLL